MDGTSGRESRGEFLASVLTETSRVKGCDMPLCKVSKLSPVPYICIMFTVQNYMC